MVRNMNYIGYTSVISGGDNPLVYEYVDYCYGAEEDDTDVIEYPVGFFFAGDDEDENYMHNGMSWSHGAHNYQEY